VDEIAPRSETEIRRAEYKEKAQRVFKLALGRKSPSTVSAYQYSLADFARFMDMDVPAEALGHLLDVGRLESELRVSEYIEWMENAGRSPSTIRVRISALKFYIRTAHRAQWVDWTLETEAPSQESVKDVRGPTPVEFQKILEVVDDLEGDTGARNRLMVYMLSFMALRISSVLSIDMEHVDRRRATVAVLWKGKRKKRVVRTVPTETMGLLIAWSEIRGPHPGPLFCNLDLRPEIRGGRLARSTAYKIIRRIGEKAGVDGLHPHAFRHFSATEGLEISDGNTRRVMKHTGHTSERMINVYEDERKDEAGQVAQEIEDRWKKKATSAE
jgi:integrase/recombinase XerD